MVIANLLFVYKAKVARILESILTGPKQICHKCYPKSDVSKDLGLGPDFTSTVRSALKAMPKALTYVSKLTDCTKFNE